MAFIVGFNLSETLVTSSANFAVAYAVGLMQAWGILWSGTLLIWMSPQFEAERVERRKRSESPDETSYPALNGSTTGGKGSTNGHALTNGHASNGNAHSSSITSVDGAVDGNFSQRKGHQISLLDAPDEDVARSLQEGYEYYWQAYPADAPFSTRFDWSLDLVSSFRGTGKRSITPRPSHSLCQSKMKLIETRLELGCPDHSAFCQSREASRQLFSRPHINPTPYTSGLSPLQDRPRVASRKSLANARRVPRAGPSLCPHDEGPLLHSRS